MVLNLAVNSVQDETDYLNNVFWHNNSLWLWRWLPHSLSKCQSLPTTTVLFSTMLNLVIMLNVLINLSCLTWSCARFCHSQAIFSISIKIIADKDAQQALLTEWTPRRPCRHSPFNWTPDVRAGFINKLKSLLCSFILVRAYKSRKA